MFTHRILSAIAIATILSSCSSVKQENLLKYVNPNIGTAHSRWFFYTPAALPHGMAKLAPSTNGQYGNPSGWEAVGYDTRHNSIEGFVHFHEWQIGGISVMPATGALKVRPGTLEAPKSGYRSAFDRKNEVAQPGYYKVLLDDYNITAELTSTERVGMHRYTFPKNEQSRILLDIGNKQGESSDVTDASISMIDDTHFEGFVTTYPKYIKLYDDKGKISMYFYGEVNKKPMHVGAFDSKEAYANKIAIKGKGAGLYLDYSTTDQEVIELKIGLSYTSIQNAKINLDTEAGKLTFQQAKDKAQQIWQKELSKITVADTNLQNKVKFYTGLYHALLGRGIASDVNGYFPKFGTDSIGRLPLKPNGKPNYNFYNTDAIWGAFWNLTQLWALSYPDRYKDFVQTHLEVYKNRGWFGDGISNGQFTSGVGTNFVGLSIAAAYNSGIRDYDVNLAYKAIKENELNGKDRPVGSGKQDVETFIKKGFVPYLENKTDESGSQFSASHTMEYSYSTFAAAQMAKSLNKMHDYKLFIDKSNSWKNLFNPSNKLIHPKNTDGSFIDKFDPLQPWRGFQEGNAVQYTFYVPQNPAGLIDKIGKQEFNDRLDNIFTIAQKNGFGGGKEIDAFAGIKSNYNHGNQPNLHVSWLFNFSGKPWLTQKWVRAICDEFYGTESIHGYGYGQDEDQGQLGSWYVIASMGLFDVKGLTDLRPIIELGSPVFENINIKLGNGKNLQIHASNNSKENVYIQSARFNGVSLNNCWLYRDELMKGGKLEFVMGNMPNTNWGVLTPPPSEQ
ncbi:MAG: GH92 family glycosyl hydrolase [Bacteroidota bacterium]